MLGSKGQTEQVSHQCSGEIHLQHLRVLHTWLQSTFVATHSSPKKGR